MVDLIEQIIMHTMHIEYENYNILNHIDNNDYYLYGTT